MSRASVSRRSVGIAFAVSVGTALGAVGLLSVAGAATPPAPYAGIAATTTGPAPAGTPASSPLTADQATAIATQASPGRVIEVDADMEANDPNDPNEANEPTGLRYDVTVLHDDGTATKIEVDAATGQVVSTEIEDDWNEN